MKCQFYAYQGMICFKPADMSAFDTIRVRLCRTRNNLIGNGFQALGDAKCTRGRLSLKAAMHLPNLMQSCGP